MLKPCPTCQRLMPEQYVACPSCRLGPAPRAAGCVTQPPRDKPKPH